MAEPFIDPFSPDYSTARNRFRKAASAAGLSLTSHPVDGISDRDGSPLTIDVAIGGRENAESAIVISSGLHGAEGFFGSAVQWAALRHAAIPKACEAQHRLVLLHGLNPYGFAHGRRFDENNVDLNRNFLPPDEKYAGAPDLYEVVGRWLNPPTPPSRRKLLPVAAGLDYLRFGEAALQATIPVGQYEFPKGLFYGGRGPAAASVIVQRNIAGWIGHARRVVHLDFHTGLGKFGTHQLLLDVPDDDPRAKWFLERFDRGTVSPAPRQETNADSSRRYRARGGLGRWCQCKFPDREYHFATAEFGTYKNSHVLAALRAENRAHHYAQDEETITWSKAWLAEAFAPASEQWRQRVVRDGLSLIATATETLK